MSGTLPFGPYQLVRRLGSGGMAETYLAVRRGPGGFEQQVCVKRILPAFEADPSFVSQFMDEARLAAQLRHANIPQVLDFGEVTGSHYLALELVDGMDLRALLSRLRERGRRLEAPFAVYVGLEIANALSFAHDPGRGRHSVIHRDISPSNVLVSRAGEVYLTDFGIARALGVKHQTESGVVRGKVPYMAAEYAMHGHFDARTDLFSVGVLLYEALSGQRPFDGVTELDTLTRISAGQHPPLSTLCDAPPAVVQVVERLLRPDPEDRFGTASELHETLARLAPSATVERQLGALVRSMSESLSESLRLSAPSRTAAFSVLPAPSYPDVSESSPDASTRTQAPVDLSSTRVDARPELWKSTDPSRVSYPGPKTDQSDPWKSTDPSQISLHDRPSPYAPSAMPSATPSASVSGSAPPPPVAPLARTRVMNDVASGNLPVVSLAPPSASSPPPAKPVKHGKRAGLYLWLAALGLIAFVIASAAAYALVHALRTGAL